MIGRNFVMGFIRLEITYENENKQYNLLQSQLFNKKVIKFPLWLKNRLISAKSEPVKNRNLSNQRYFF